MSSRTLEEDPSLDAEVERLMRMALDDESPEGQTIWDAMRVDRPSIEDLDEVERRLKTEVRRALDGKPSCVGYFLLDALQEECEWRAGVR